MDAYTVLTTTKIPARQSDGKYSICSKVSNNFLFLFSNRMLVFEAEIHELFARIANWEYPDQTVSSEAKSDMGLRCLPWPLWQVTSVQNLRTSTV